MTGDDRLWGERQTVSISHTSVSSSRTSNTLSTTAQLTWWAYHSVSVLIEVNACIIAIINIIINNSTADI